MTSALVLLQWIATINNISKRIYLSENAEVRSRETNTNTHFWLQKKAESRFINVK